VDVNDLILKNSDLIGVYQNKMWESIEQQQSEKCSEVISVERIMRLILKNEFNS